MTTLDTLAIGTPVAYFVILGLLGFVEYRWIERAKRREQLALAEGAKLSKRDPAAPAAHPDSAAAAKPQVAAE
jgi:hypothetical protein